MDVMSAIDFIDAHMLPFFSTEASRGKPNKSKYCCFLTLIYRNLIAASESWPIVQKDLNWFYSNGQNKKLYLSQVSRP